MSQIGHDVGQVLDGVQAVGEAADEDQGVGFGAVDVGVFECDEVCILYLVRPGQRVRMDSIDTEWERKREIGL